MSLEKKIGVRVTAKTDQAAAELDKVGGAADRAAARLQKLGRNGGELKKAMSFERLASGATMAAGVIAGTAYSIDRVIMSQVKYNALLRNAPFDIKAATEATQGFISQTTLLDSAIAANRAGFIKSSKQYAEFTGNVQKLAMATGEDTTEALNVLTRALAKNESELLDNYNINLKVKQAQEMLEKQYGRTLTEEEKATAFGIIGMQKIAEVAKKANVQLEIHEQWWMKIKAAVLDFPATMTAASNAIEGFFVKVDHWQKVTGMNIRGETLVAGNNRQGVGVKGMGAVAEKMQMDAFNKADQMTPAIGGWVKRQEDHARWLADTGGQAMLDAMESTFEGLVTGKGKKGKKKPFQWSKRIRDQIALENARDAMQRDGSDSRDYAAGLREAQMSQSLTAMRESAMKSAAELELARAEATITAREMGIEMMRARGIDRESMADAETQIEQARLDAHQTYIEQTMRGEERLMALEELHAKRREVQFKSDLRRQKKHTEAMQSMGDSLVDVHAGVAGAAIAGAFASDQSVKASVASFAKAKGIEMTILAATEAIKAIAAAASFNFVGAQAHGTAAAMAAAEAGVLLALAGATGGFSGGGGSGRGASPRSPGSHPRPSRDRDSQPSNQGAPPISHTNAGPSRPPPPTSQANKGPAPVVNFYSMFPPDAEQQMILLRRTWAKSVRDNPNV